MAVQTLRFGLDSFLSVFALASGRLKCVKST